MRKEKNISLMRITNTLLFLPLPPNFVSYLVYVILVEVCILCDGLILLAIMK